MLTHQQKPGDFENVADDNIKFMLYLLDGKDLVNLAQTSKYFHNLIQEIFQTAYGEGLIYAHHLEYGSEKMNHAFEVLFSQIEQELIRRFRGVLDNETNELSTPANNNNNILFLGFIGVVTSLLLTQFTATYAEPSLLNITILFGLVGVFVFSMGYQLIANTLSNCPPFTANVFNPELLNNKQLARVKALYTEFQDLFRFDSDRQDLLGRDILFAMKSCVENNKTGLQYHLQEFRKHHNKTWRKESDSSEVQNLRRFLDNSVNSGIKLFSKWTNRNPNLTRLKKDPQKSLNNKKIQ